MNNYSGYSKLFKTILYDTDMEESGLILISDLTQLLPQAHTQLSSELVKIPAVSVVVVVVELADRIELPTPVSLFFKYLPFLL